jgi:hypothetical protein
VQQVEEALKGFSEVALVMTTVGTNDGRNYARINLRLTEARARNRTQKEIERAIRTTLSPFPASSSRSASTGRCGSICWGPIRDAY